MKLKNIAAIVASVLFGLGAVVVSVSANDRDDRNDGERQQSASPIDRQIDKHGARMIDDGRQIFRFDTFGSESFWGGNLRLHEAIAGSKNGGVAAGVSPKTALAVGLKVDVDALPERLKRDIAAGRVNLDDPAVTVALIKLNAVVGVTGFFDGPRIRSLGLQCAFCHATVDDSFAPGIGRRLDGWANR